MEEDGDTSNWRSLKILSRIHIEISDLDITHAGYMSSLVVFGDM